MDRPFLEMTFILNGLLVAFVLLTNVTAQGPSPVCVPTAIVKRNTRSVSINSQLTLNCDVSYCEEKPTIHWTKINTAEWIKVNNTSQITLTQEESTSGLKTVTARLHFKSISKHDDGLYRCVIYTSNFSSESHQMNVSVSNSSQDNTSENSSESTGGMKSPDSRPHWLPYILICSGIFGLVTVVMLISFLGIHGCTCLRKVNKHKTQCASSCPIPSSAYISAHYRNPGGQEKGQQNHTDMSKVTLKPDTSSVLPQFGLEDRESQQIVYATLEHLTPRDPSVLNQASREQCSEYASIRLS